MARLVRTHSNSAPWGYDYATQYYRKLTVSLPRFLSQPAMVGTLEEKADATAEQTRRAAIVHVAEEHPCHNDLLNIVEQIEATFVPKAIHGERYPITFNFSTHHGPLHVDCPDSDGPGTHIVVYCLRYPTRHNGILLLYTLFSGSGLLLFTDHATDPDHTLWVRGSSTSSSINNSTRNRT